MKFLIICLIFLSATIEAKLKIEISQGSKDIVKIAIVPFSDGKKTNIALSDLIEKNLT